MIIRCFSSELRLPLLDRPFTQSAISQSNRETWWVAKGFPGNFRRISAPAVIALNHVSRSRYSYRAQNHQGIAFAKHCNTRWHDPVHGEFCGSMTTEDCFLAIKWFVSHRDRPGTFYFDKKKNCCSWNNARTFVSVAELLAQCWIPWAIWQPHFELLVRSLI